MRVRDGRERETHTDTPGILTGLLYVTARPANLNSLQPPDSTNLLSSSIPPLSLSHPHTHSHTSTTTTTTTTSEHTFCCYISVSPHAQRNKG